MCEHEVQFFVTILQSITLLLPFFIEYFAPTAKYLGDIVPVGVGIKDHLMLQAQSRVTAPG